MSLYLDPKLSQRVHPMKQPYRESVEYPMSGVEAQVSIILVYEIDWMMWKRFVIRGVAGV